MLNFAMFYSYISSPELGSLAVFRMLQLSLKYGLAAPAVPAFASYGYLLSMHLGRRKEGIRYGQISLTLLHDLDKSDAQAWLPRTFFLVHGHVNRWAFPLRDSLEPLLQAHRIALKTGDMEFGMNTASAYLEMAFYSGKELAELELETRSMLMVMDSFGQTFGIVFMLPLWQLISDLMGCSLPPLNLASSIKTADDAMKQALTDGNATALWMFHKYNAVYACFRGDHQSCLAHAQNSRRAHSGGRNIWRTFYEGLSSLAIARDHKYCARWRKQSLG